MLHFYTISTRLLFIQKSIFPETLKIELNFLFHFFFHFSDINSVNYTTLIDSRYFIMTWPQENHLGKTRSGLCKYSLTPQLDTLASIREFKSMRHTIRYLECMSGKFKQKIIHLKLPN